jgi:hypothetical protein
MRVLAASFDRREAALHVLGLLRERYQLDATDASVAPLAAAGPGEAPAPTVLAGRFREERVDQVRRLCEEHGGQVVVVVDESITRPRRDERGSEPTGRQAPH